MLLDALVERGENLQRFSGYTENKVEVTIRIDAEGQFLGVDTTPQKALLPFNTPARTRGVSALCVDNLVYTLGISDLGKDLVYAQTRHQAFLQTLQKIAHPGAKAVLAFLTDPRRPIFLPLGSEITADQIEIVRWSPPIHDGFTGNPPVLVDKSNRLTSDSTVLGLYACVVLSAIESHPTGIAEFISFKAKTKSIVLIEVEGFPQWWLSPEAQQSHQQKRQETNANGKEEAQQMCSLCGQVRVLTRTFDKSVKSCSLISFQQSAWCSYNLEQAYNAPTCVGCAAKLTAGLNDVLGSKILTKPLSKERFLCWWTKSFTDPNPWELLEGIFKDPKNPVFWDQFTDTHFAIFTKGKGRLSVRGYGQIPVDVLRHSLYHWTNAGLDNVWAVAAALTKEGEATSVNESEVAKIQEQLYRALFFQTPLSPNLLHRTENLLRRDCFTLESPTNQRRIAILRFAGYPEYFMIPNLTKLAPTEQFAFLMGRALACAEECQKRRSNYKIQRSLRHTHFEAALVRPHIAGELVRKHGKYRTKQGQVRDQPQAHEFMLQAFTAVGGEAPTTYNSKERSLFNFGYQTQVKDMEEANRLRREKHGQNKDGVSVDTNASSPDNEDEVLVYPG